MDERVRDFLARNHFAVMTTIKPDGAPHVAVVGVGLVEGKLWSSATQTRVRTGHLRRDPRATLCVIDRRNPWSWVALESEVAILEGEDAPRQNLALYKVIRGEGPEDEEEYLRAMVEEQRLIFEFRITRSYGPV
jgi:PPOX class probable F420-dependent enzyme